MEKRRDNRVNKKIPICFTYEGQTFHSFTGDISRRGVFIETLQAIPSRRGITLEIRGKKDRVRMAGFIIWSKKAAPSSIMLQREGIGVQLLDYQKPAYQELVSESS